MKFFTFAVQTILLVIATAFACVAPSHASDDFGAVVLKVRVVDRAEKPVAGVRVRFSAQLDGVASYHGAAPSPTQLIGQSAQREATTNPAGIATVTVASTILPAPDKWFRGTVHFVAQTIATPTCDACPVGARTISGNLSIPADSPVEQNLSGGLPTLHIWEVPDTYVDGFPLWLGKNKRPDRVVVLVEGFDLYNSFSATDSLRLVGVAGDALRQAGMSLLVVNFEDSHQSPEQLAPIVSRAVRAAAQTAGGKPVAVAGLSAGGIVARWSLVAAEETGTPLPVHTLVFLDTPHRGARINPALQAMTLRYGKKADRDALGSDAARVLLTECVTDSDHQVRWRRIGPPLAQRDVPVECTPDTAIHETFYARLRRLNDHNGYPKNCRLVAVANSSRNNNRPVSNLMRLWLPWGSAWDLRADQSDLSAGSLIPSYYVEQFHVAYPLGLAGAYLPTVPTFLPSASALDATPQETPPFDAWYARPDGLTPLAHDQVDPAVATFVVREIVKSPWK